jgi:hypothetical protein
MEKQTKPALEWGRRESKELTRDLDIDRRSDQQIVVTNERPNALPSYREKGATNLGF